jgi:long-subunit fatty acid transport protein
MKKIFLGITLILTLNITAISGSSKTGTNAYQFLKIGVGAKSESMAGAYVGLADDISSLSINPAGLAAPVYDIRATSNYYYEESEGEGEGAIRSRFESDSESLIKQKQFKTNRFFATYINYLLDFQSGYLGYARIINSTSVVGVSIQYQDYGTFDKYNGIGENTGTFGASDFAIGFTYSKRINTEISLGITGKFIVENIDTATSDGMAVDLGGIYRLTDGRTSLGLAVRNLGTQLKGLTKTHKDPLPLIFDVGMSHSLRGMPLTINADVTVPTDNDVFLSIGGQWESFRPFFIRAGWSSAGQDYKTESDKDKYGGLAGGFGYQYGDYYIDYAYSSFADIDNVHRFSIGIEF